MENNKITKLETTMDYIKKDINDIKSTITNFKSDFKDFKDTMEEKFVTRREFSPIQKIVYGMVGTILTSVLVALLYLVLNK